MTPREQGHFFETELFQLLHHYTQIFVLLSLSSLYNNGSLKLNGNYFVLTRILQFSSSTGVSQFLGYIELGKTERGNGRIKTIRHPSALPTFCGLVVHFSYTEQRQGEFTSPLHWQSPLILYATPLSKDVFHLSLFPSIFFVQGYCDITYKRYMYDMCILNKLYFIGNYFHLPYIFCFMQYVYSVRDFTCTSSFHAEQTRCFVCDNENFMSYRGPLWKQFYFKRARAPYVRYKWITKKIHHKSIRRIWILDFNMFFLSIFNQIKNTSNTHIYLEQGSQ